MELLFGRRARPGHAAALAGTMRTLGLPQVIAAKEIRRRLALAPTAPRILDPQSKRAAKDALHQFSSAGGLSKELSAERPKSGTSRNAGTCSRNWPCWLMPPEGLSLASQTQMLPMSQAEASPRRGDGMQVYGGSTAEFGDRRSLVSGGKS